MLGFEDIRNNQTINVYVEKADEALKALGYTEHSFVHIMMVTVRTEYILKMLEYDQRTIELAKIAAYMHDIGNVVNRVDHSQSGAIMAFRILDKIGFEDIEIAEIIKAIGNHDEGNGVPVSPLAAALILADKSDVRRSRVRNSDISSFDIHDRVNYSVTDNKLEINQDKKEVYLILETDNHFCTVMDYFSIFLERMKLCEKAAVALGLKFKLIINNQEVI